MKEKELDEILEALDSLDPWLEAREWKFLKRFHPRLHKELLARMKEKS